MRGGFATYSADAEQHFNGLALETSSGSSSPNSSSSNEELQVVDRSETGLTNRAKPLYNFSIPDIIKHDRSTSVGSGIARSNDDVVSGDAIGSDCIQTLKRRRTAEEDGPSRILPRNRSGGDGITRSAKQRRTGTGASAGGYHPVIDLTTTPDSPDIQPIHLLDDSTDVHSDSEVSVTGLETRNYETPLATPSLDDDSIECIRRRLRETQQESARLMRDAQSRLSRVRRRISRLSPRVITDGPVYDYSSINGFNHGGQSDSRRQRSYLGDDPPVINLDQDASLTNVSHDQSGAAPRTVEPGYSSRYLAPQDNAHPSDLAPPGNVASVNTQTRDQELSRLREQVTHFQQQVRERYEAAQARLQRLRYIVRERGNDLPYPLRRPPHVNLENESGGQDGSEDEVEIVHEWRRSYQGSGQSSRTSGVEGNRGPSVGDYGRLGHRRSTAIFYPHRLPGIPDFLLPVVFSPVSAPPLHHYPPGSGTMLEGEDYEALWSLAERIGPAKPRGLCKTVIGQIPSFRFSASNASETNTTCVVCMCEYTNREKLRKLPCSHDFHSKCIDKWLRSNRTCPVCRDEVKVKPQ